MSKDIPLPETIGHYKVVSQLGRGGMGVVYKAREESLNRFVAIKVLTEQLSEDATFLQRFVREAQAAAGLSHPNIVQIFFIGEDQGHPYFVMEYVTGKSLNHLLREQRQISNPRAAQLILQAAHGLAAAHDQGIIHRDIKPANLILDERGIVKIADFGLALPPGAETRLTATGMLVGTPGYLAPEQCRGEKIDQRTDIYALGVTFYELLGGQPPFRGESPLALLRQILDEEPPAIASLNPSVDDETRRILQKMIAKDRSQRYQNSHEIVADLEEYLAKHGVRSVTAGLSTPRLATAEIAATAAATATATQVLQSGVQKATPENTPTMMVANAASPVTLPETPFVARNTVVPPPAPAHRSSSSRLALIALAVLLLLGGGIAAAFLLGRRPQPDTAATPPKPTPTAASALTTTNPQPGVLLSQEIKPTMTDTTVSAAPAQPAPQPAPAKVSTQPSAPPAAVVEHRPATPARTERPRSGVAVAVTGDRGLSGAVSSVLTSELGAAGLQVVDAQSLPSTEDLLRGGDVSASRLIDRLRDEGLAVLLLARVDATGQRELSYLGRHDIAYSSRITLTTYDLATGRPFGTPNSATIEYTAATADRESEKVVGPLARSSAEAIQNR